MALPMLLLFPETLFRATILPAGCTPGSPIQDYDFWVGEITGIRAWVDATNDSNEVAPISLLLQRELMNSEGVGENSLAL
jgi:hypothetical protein